MWPSLIYFVMYTVVRLHLNMDFLHLLCPAKDGQLISYIACTDLHYRAHNDWSMLNVGYTYLLWRTHIIQLTSGVASRHISILHTSVVDAKRVLATSP